MNLHEYQGKALFAEYGLPVSIGHAVESAEAAIEAATKIGGNQWVVKAQVHAGGRGKAGGVKLIDSPQAAGDFRQTVVGRAIGDLSDRCRRPARIANLGRVLYGYCRRVVFGRSG